LAGPCNELSDPEYPAQGFVFVLKDANPVGIKMFLLDAMKLISNLQQNSIAHNLFMTRASTKEQAGHFDSVRIFIWGRTSSYGKLELCFHDGLDAFSFTSQFLKNRSKGVWGIQSSSL